MEAVPDAQSPPAREDYQENVAPLLDQLRMFLAGAETNAESTTFTTMITIE